MEFERHRHTGNGFPFNDLRLEHANCSLGQDTSETGATMSFRPDVCRFNEALSGSSRLNWSAVATGFLRQHERHIAVARLKQAIQWYVRHHGMPSGTASTKHDHQRLNQPDIELLAYAMVREGALYLPQVIFAQGRDYAMSGSQSARFRSDESWASASSPLQFLHFEVISLLR
jgi:hypothetical protein